MGHLNGVRCDVQWQKHFCGVTKSFLQTIICALVEAGASEP